MKTFVSTILSVWFINITHAQQIKKDTLFFKYDPKYILNFEQAPGVYYLKDSHSSNSGTFFFKEVNSEASIDKYRTKCLRKFVISSEFYDRKKKLKDRETAEFFNKYIVFLVRKDSGKIKFIQVQGAFEIE
jgi:hypothetical protein